MRDGPHRCAIALSPDLRTVAIGYSDLQIHLFDPESGGATRQLEHGVDGRVDRDFASLDFLPLDRRLVSAGSDGRTVIRRLER